MKIIFRITVLLIIFITASSDINGEIILQLNNKIYISNNNNMFYNPFEKRIFLNIPGKFVGISTPNTKIIIQGEKTINLKEKSLIYNNQPYISYDDYLKFWKIGKIKQFSIVSLYELGLSSCIALPQIKDITYLKELQNRESDIVIVIDPGHGGEDGGALGPHCTKEKDVVFAIAEKLALLFKRETNFKIFLTRYTDKYITLPERSKMANELNADFFVSIHANSAPRTTAEGVETFFFSNHYSDLEAKNIALLENKWASDTGEIKENKTVNSIVSDMLQTKISNESARLASFIQKEIITITKEFSRGFKRANFWVLKGTKMPAVLVETGFISNEKEEKKLNDNKYRTQVAKGIYNGIMKYLKTNGLLNKNWSKYENRRKRKQSVTRD